MITTTIVKLVVFNNSRLFSSITPGSLAPMAVKDNKITNDTINKLLLKQQVSITQEKLDRLLSIKGVTFELPLTNETLLAYYALVGRPNTKGLRTGIYIFTHIKSGSKYVGSSNSLSRRLEQYFNPDPLFAKQYGLLLPLIKREGFAAFKLEIYVIPEQFAKDYSYLFLEQYYLLKKEFDLNSQRIVNFRTNQGNGVYMYDKDGKTLYYHSSSMSGMRGDLGLHHATVTKCINNGLLYLDYFMISNQLITNATKVNLSLQELNDLIVEKRSLLLKSFSKITSKAIRIKQVKTGNIKNFTSITSVVNYFKDKGIRANRNKIAKCLNTNEIYLDYTYYAP